MSTDFTEQLAGLRARIDAIDSDIMARLQQRMEVIREVSALKAAHAPAQCHIRSGREGDMHARIVKAFEGSDFPPAAALAIWRQIIGTSTHLESPITVSIAAPDDTHYMAWLARAYFGRMISLHYSRSIHEAIEATERGDATITLLPSPHTDTLPQWRGLASSSLKIFAGVPVILAANEAPLAYAAARLTPEPSADDLTLCLGKTAPDDAVSVLASDAEGALFTLADSHAEVSTHYTILGMIPRPLRDPSLTPWSIL